MMGGAPGVSPPAGAAFGAAPGAGGGGTGGTGGGPGYTTSTGVIVVSGAGSPPGGAALNSGGGGGVPPGAGGSGAGAAPHMVTAVCTPCSVLSCFGCGPGITPSTAPVPPPGTTLRMNTADGERSFTEARVGGLATLTSAGVLPAGGLSAAGGSTRGEGGGMGGGVAGGGPTGVGIVAVSHQSMVTGGELPPPNMEGIGGVVGGGGGAWDETEGGGGGGGVAGGEFACRPAPPRAPLERFDNGTVVHPTVVMDCTCRHPHDDGKGWYKGRAGTSAYWPPQMIGRDGRGERVSYGADSDWWSYGCLVYCLMTGRSPFASGAGTAADNALTLAGRIVWPRGIFSREAKDFISRLLEVDPARRLGSGPRGWNDVMMHPWFASVDWGLLEAKVLPAPCVPPYRMATNLVTPPEKVPGQYQTQAATEAAAAEAAAVTAAAALRLTAEDEAIFEAVTYTAPDMLVRSVIKAVQNNDGPAVPGMLSPTDGMDLVGGPMLDGSGGGMQIRLPTASSDMRRTTSVRSESASPVVVRPALTISPGSRAAPALVDGGTRRHSVTLSPTSRPLAATPLPASEGRASGGSGSASGGGGVGSAAAGPAATGGGGGGSGVAGSGSGLGSGSGVGGSGGVGSSGGVPPGGHANSNGGPAHLSPPPLAVVRDVGSSKHAILPMAAVGGSGSEAVLPSQVPPAA